MLFGDMVNVFIALALAYATVALVVTAVTEAISSALALRSKTLLTGLKSILNDKNLTGLAGAIINHAAVNPRAPGTDVQESASRAYRPSYIQPSQFATALIDTLQGQSATPDGKLPPIEQVALKGAALAAAAPAAFSDLGTAIDNIADPQLRTLFKGIYSRADGKAEKFHADVASWFDSAMDRVSGTYKRWTQWVSVVIAFAIAVLLNIDTIHIAQAIWIHPAAMDLVKGGQLVTANLQASNALQTLSQIDFPFGWKHSADEILAEICHAPWHSLQIAVERVVGCTLTALAALLGAPFWFDMLQKFVRISGSGPKPKVKSANGAKP